MHQITEAEALHASLDLSAEDVAAVAGFFANLPLLTVPELMAITARVAASRDRLARVGWCSRADLNEQARLALRLRAMWSGIEGEMRRRMGGGRKG